MTKKQKAILKWLQGGAHSGDLTGAIAAALKAVGVDANNENTRKMIKVISSAHGGLSPTALVSEIIKSLRVKDTQAARETLGGFAESAAPSIKAQLELGEMIQGMGADDLKVVQEYLAENIFTPPETYEAGTVEVSKEWLQSILERGYSPLEAESTMISEYTPTGEIDINFYARYNLGEPADFGQRIQRTLEDDDDEDDDESEDEFAGGKKPGAYGGESAGDLIDRAIVANERTQIIYDYIAQEGAGSVSWMLPLCGILSESIDIVMKMIKNGDLGKVGKIMDKIEEILDEAEANMYYYMTEESASRYMAELETMTTR